MDNSMLLDALCRKGVLISVSIRYWRGRRKLNPEDLGLDRDNVNSRLISLGHKCLVPKESMQRLALIEGRAHAAVEESSFSFLNGVARYLPNSRLESVMAKLQELKTEFAGEQQRFLANYADLRHQALGEWRHCAQALTADPERLVNAVTQAFPLADQLPSRFGFNIRLFQIAVPEVSTTELVDYGSQQQLIETRHAATQQARQEIEHSCREFIAESIATLREQTATLCSEMLATINGTGSVHQKTLNRLIRFIDQFQELNFANDQEMNLQLQRIRQEFLSKTAGDYRDSRFARMQLTRSLENLGNRAAELAQEPVDTLINNFGEFGRRKFALAS